MKIGLPRVPFFLFGMGSRRKLLYKKGVLRDVFSGEAVARWDVAADRIAPAEYTVHIETRDGRDVAIREDAEAVWVEEGGNREALARGAVALPTFEGHPHAEALRTLHQEMLVNIVGGAPVPNLLVYKRPWYRDAAMVCLCLEKTGNVDLVREWILGLREVFDGNNRRDGVPEEEPDNLGQLLYLVSLVSDASHPVVERVLATAERFRRGRCLCGRTDFAEHPVYQTKWLKFGLGRLGLEDAWEIPAVQDSYSALFWMDYRDQHVACPPFDARGRALYPYLGWAEDHFHGRPPAALPAPGAYPLTWEAGAGQADYGGMAIVSGAYVERRIAAPHTWHASEMFLYLLELA